MSFLITNYEVVNGTKYESRSKSIPKKTLKEIDELQNRAERIWNNGIDKDDEHYVAVFINYVNYNRHNRKSPNIGKHDFRLEKWI